MHRKVFLLSLAALSAGCEAPQPRVWDAIPAMDPNASSYDQALIEWERGIKLAAQKQAATLGPGAQDLLEIQFNDSFPKWRAEVESELAATIAAERKRQAHELLRQIAADKGWSAAAARLRDPSFQREMTLSLTEAGELMNAISSFEAKERNVGRNPTFEVRKPQ